MTARTGRIPLWIKLAYTAFVAVLVPYYWSADGPTNFLYCCDVALLMALAWLTLLMVVLPLAVFLPTHLILKRVYRPPAATTSG